MTRKTGPVTPEPTPMRPVISRPLSTWHERLKQELIAEGVPHDKASLVSLRVLSALIPQQRKLEIVDDALRVG